MEMDSIGENKQAVERNAKNAPVKDLLWNASDLSTHSETHLEDDPGEGDAAIIRMFEFSANPEAFKLHQPTKQELFNNHYKHIEVILWRDGLKVMPEVNPKVTINKKKTKYRIFVGATPQKGHLLRETPQTLKELTKK